MLSSMKKQCGEHRGKQSAHPTIKELSHIKASVNFLMDNFLRDQISRNNKEYINANKSPTNTKKLGMKYDHQNDGKRPEAIYIRSIRDIRLT